MLIVVIFISLRDILYVLSSLNPSQKVLSKHPFNCIGVPILFRKLYTVVHYKLHTLKSTHILETLEYLLLKYFFNLRRICTQYIDYVMVHVGISTRCGDYDSLVLIYTYCCKIIGRVVVVEGSILHTRL